MFNIFQIIAQSIVFLGSLALQKKTQELKRLLEVCTAVGKGRPSIDL